MKTLSTLLALCAAVWFTPPAAAQSNTIVRFHFYRGATAIGDVDVEMFDYEKPVTVSNFLRYVRSGAYHNLVLNRCLPNFVIQAGALWSPKPLAGAAFFSELSLTPNYGSITNEFSVGQQFSNVFGTIAMARVGGDTNSASSEFFLNLADNNSTNAPFRTDLDKVDGGFTVFGKVMDPASASRLDYFNHPSSTLNFLHLGGYYADLPVGVLNRPCTTTANCPRSLDLYHIKISILPTNDLVAPKITIISPRQNAIITGSPITITGTASDNQGVSSILYLVGDQPFGNAPGATNWSITTELAAGPNLIVVSSVDGAGQRSPVDRRSVFYKVPEPFRLTTNGSGAVFGATNLQPFDITKLVTLTARPAPGHVFGRWTGSYTYAPPRITFPMHTNAILNANFLPNPFPPLKATYSGMFHNTNAPNQPNGSITFTVTDLGRVTGRLNVSGRNLPFSGTISPYGEANIPVSVAPLFGVQWNWYIVFNLDVTNRTDRLLPSDATGYPYVWDPTGIPGIAPQFASALSVHRVRAGTAAQPSLFAGKYTLSFPGGTNTATEPGGDSYGTVTVSATGVGTVTGSLADGTPFVMSAPVTTNGLWPLYTGLYAARGWLHGWNQFHLADPIHQVRAGLSWKRAAQASTAFPGGFHLFPGMAGSTYTNPPGLASRILSFSNGIVELSGPNLVSAVSNNVIVNPNNTVVNAPASTNRLTFAIVKPNGLFSGTVRPVGEARIIPFKGALLRGRDSGAGYYLSTNLSGRVRFFGTTPTE